MKRSHIQTAFQRATTTLLATGEHASVFKLSGTLKPLSDACGVQLKGQDGWVVKRVVLTPSMDKRDVFRQVKTQQALAAQGLAPEVAAWWCWDGMCYIVMKNLRGGMHTATGTETPVQQLKVVQTLKALIDLGYIHNNLSPHNIGFTKKGMAQVIDFDFAQKVKVKQAMKQYMLAYCLHQFAAKMHGRGVFVDSVYSDILVQIQMGSYKW